MYMPEGYMSAVQSALKTHIAAADSELAPEDTHVFESYENDIWDMDTENLPIVTIRMGPSNTIEAVHGRILKGKATITKGTYSMMFFSAHIHAAISTTSEEDKTVNAMDFGEMIKTKLLKSDDSTSGIVHYERITLREAPLNMHQVARVIMEGYILVRRPHT